MQLGVRFFKKSDPLKSHIRRFSKNELVRTILYREQIIYQHENRLEFFIVFKHINPIFDEKFKKKRVNTVSYMFLTFSAFSCFTSSNILRIVRYYTQRRHIPAVPKLTLNYIVSTQISLHKLYWFVRSVLAQYFFIALPYDVILTRKTRRLITLISYNRSNSSRISLCRSKLLIPPKCLQLVSSFQTILPAGPFISEYSRPVLFGLTFLLIRNTHKFWPVRFVHFSFRIYFLYFFFKTLIYFFIHLYKLFARSTFSLCLQQTCKILYASFPQIGRNDVVSCIFIYVKSLKNIRKHAFSQFLLRFDSQNCKFLQRFNKLRFPQMSIQQSIQHGVTIRNVFSPQPNVKQLCSVQSTVSLCI